MTILYKYHDGHGPGAVPVQATVGADGSDTIVVQEIDLGSGEGVGEHDPIDGILTVTDINVPGAGFIYGTLDADNNNSMVRCTVDIDTVGSGQNVIFCVGQNPGDEDDLFSILLVSQ